MNHLISQLIGKPNRERWGVLTESQWKWADLVIKSIGVAAITAAISIYNINSQKTQSEIARKETRFESAVQLSSTQKTLDVNVGMQMFDDFIGHYIQICALDSEEKVRQTILMLRLVSLNFQDVPINLKPLFEDVHERLQSIDKIPDDVRKNLQEKLFNVAREVASRQAHRLTFLDGNLQDVPDLEKGDKRDIDRTTYSLEVSEIDEGKVALIAEQTEFTEDGTRKIVQDTQIGTFELSYFDMPLVDNIKIDETRRLAVTLRKIDGQKADIRVVSFRSDLAGDRFDVKEMSRDFLDVSKGNEVSWLSQIFCAGSY